MALKIKGNKEELLMDVIITKYVKGSKWCINLMRKQYGLSLWKYIRSLRDEFNDKCRLKVVSDCNTKMQLDRWLDDLPLKEVIPVTYDW